MHNNLTCPKITNFETRHDNYKDIFSFIYVRGFFFVILNKMSMKNYC